MSSAKLNALFCLFKGEWGLRKSTQALSFPTPQYWFSFDQKMESLLLPMKKWGIDEKVIHYDDYNNWNKAEEKLKRLQTNCEYKTIVLDTIGLMGDATNRQTRHIKSGTTKTDGSEKGIRVAGIVVNSMEDYKAETAALQDMMAMLKDIHKYHKSNVILVAHVIYDRMPEGKSETHVARGIVTGAKQMGAKIPGYCHEVYHFNLKGDFGQDKKYALLTHHTREDFARTALPLDKEIIFEEQPLYPNWLVPAIEKLGKMETVLPKKF